MAEETSEQETLLASVEQLSRTKSLAESRVKLVRALVADSEKDEQDLTRMRVLYEDARANVNAGLDRLLVEMEGSARVESAESYRRAADIADEKAGTFLKESGTLILGEDRSVVEAGVKAAGSVVSALVDIWKTLRGEKKGMRAAVTKRIETLKWSPFDEIK